MENIHAVYHQYKLDNLLRLLLWKFDNHKLIMQFFEQVFAVIGCIVSAFDYSYDRETLRPAKIDLQAKAADLLSPLNDIK